MCRLGSCNRYRDSFWENRLAGTSTNMRCNHSLSSYQVTQLKPNTEVLMLVWDKYLEDMTALCDTYADFVPWLLVGSGT